MQRIVYGFLKIVVRISLRLFYRSLTVHGLEYRKLKGPFIVVSNHPNTLMDALIVATRLQKRIGFMGNASLFRNPTVAKVLKFFQIIPVYRKQDLLPGETMNQNVDTFQKAYDFLAKGGAFLVFPEGTSIAERKLREVKTGTARIGLGFEEQMDFKGGLKILPISINYSSSTHFRTYVHVNLNEPVTVAHYKSLHQQDPREAVQELTQAISDRLADGLVILDDPEQEEMFAQAVRLFREQLDGKQSFRRPSRKGFEEEKTMAEGLRKLKQERPLHYAKLRDDLESWFGLVDRLGLRHSLLGDRALRFNPFLLAVASSLLLIVGLPFALIGFVTGIIPYKLSGILPPKIAKDIEYRAPLMLMLGIILFPLMYLIITGLYFLLGGCAFHWAWGFAVFFGLPICGWLTLAWLDHWGRLQALSRLIWMEGRGGKVGEKLRERRQALLKSLKGA